MTLLNNTLYPALRYDFEDDHDPQISQFIDTLPLDKIASLIHPQLDQLDRHSLTDALADALAAYVQGALYRIGQRSEKEDNFALERIANVARDLHERLLASMDHPGLVTQLQESTRRVNTLHTLPNGDTLADLVGSDGRSYRDLCELLVDLQVSAENVILRKPKPQIIDGSDDEPDIRLDTDEELAERMAEYQRRSAERRIPKDHALQEFLRSLKPYWIAHSPYPFTEGMHHREQGQTISNAVDVIEMVLRPFDNDVTRQKIVTALRKTN